MQYIDQAQANFLYENIENILRTGGLSEKERIPKYRTVLESLFKQLTSDEKRYLDGLNARIVFITTEYNTPPDIKNLAHHLRTFANDVVHNMEIQVNPADDARCLYALATVVAHFSQTQIPDLIRRSYEPWQADFAAELQRPRKKTPVFSFRAIVRDIYVPKEVHSRKHCAIVCDTDELGTINIKFWDNRKEDGFGSDLSGVHAFLWPYCNIYITDVKPYANRPGEYHATESTLLVLEPDYLIEAKELAECCQSKGDNPLLHLLNRFTKGEITDKMMVGNISGEMLDDLATDPKFNYTASFEQVMRDNSFGMLCMAHQEGTYRREAIKAVYDAGAALEPTIRYALNSIKGGKILSLEPTFISDKYGLQGRLDVMLEDPANPQRKDIVEMKAGNYHPKSLFPNHEAQVLAYSLMLESTFPGRQGLSAILYAKASQAETPLRAVRDDSPLRKQALLLLRNRIVANELRLAGGNMEPLTSLCPDTFGAAPDFVLDNVTTFHQMLQEASPLLRAWFLGFTRFVFREMQVGKTGNPDNPDDPGGFSALWRAEKSEKVASYNALTYLKLQNISDDLEITLKIDTHLFFSGVTNFREGESVILYPTPDPENPNPLRQQILKCYILTLAPDHVVVRLENNQLDEIWFKRSKVWAIERDFRESGYRTMLHQLYRFLQADAVKQDTILGLKRPEFNVGNEINVVNEINAVYGSVGGNGKNGVGQHNGVNGRVELNDNQRAIVEQALAARDYFLIQGPPGTGKTSTVLRELVHRMAGQGLNIMVIAFTNQAVKVICEKLTSLGIEFIRLGRGEEDYCWQNLAGRLKLDQLYEQVARTHVFVSTQATFAGSLDLLRFKKFHTLVVDEASQLLEPQLAGILSQFERFIMIGDDNQLPAVVLQDENATRTHAPELTAVGLHNFRESLFTRLLANARRRGWHDCFGMLEYHYRMHADIAAFPNEHFYGGRLKTGKPEQLAPLDWPESDHPLRAVFEQRVSFIPTRRDIRPKVNEEEAGLVAELIACVHQLYGDRFDPEKTVGVITPFRAQVATIRQKLPPQYQSVTIDTVERFQGSERDVIIVSFAVKNPLQLRAIQSVNAEGVDRKLNVMMTRAKECLVMMGCEEVVGALFGLNTGQDAQLSAFIPKARPTAN
ncbi:MAG: RecBCD enzyme subunit RecD [Saprospiraceae bacterium]|nr:RecBCD enzyme subunit RecD [Saprospiraceae bacterium]